MFHRLIFISFLIFLVSCQTDPGTQKVESPLKKKLIGVWQAQSMRVVMNSVNDTPHSVVFEASAENWEKQLKMKKIETQYKQDGSYTQRFRDVNGNIQHIVSGNWHVIIDTVYMYQHIPAPAAKKFLVQISDNKGEFTGFVDFDEDGRIDDDFYGIEIRLGDSVPKVWPE